MRRRAAPSGLIVAGALVALLAGACSSASASPAATPAAAASTAASSAPAATPVSVAEMVPQAMRGTWTSNVQGTTATSGTWILDATAANLSLQNPHPGADPFTLDPSAITDTQITLPKDPECPDQATPTEGTYAWKIVGTTLTFTLIADSCGDRSGVLVAAPWTRKS